MDVAAKLGAAKPDYGSPPEIARGRARHQARFDFASSRVAAAARTPEPRTGAAALDPPRSAHAERSVAQNALIEAQAQAVPALERIPAALRTRTAFAPSKGDAEFDATAEAALNRLRDTGAERHLRPVAAPPSEMEAQKGATAYQRALELPG